MAEAGPDSPKGAPAADLNTVDLYHGGGDHNENIFPKLSDQPQVDTEALFNYVGPLDVSVSDPEKKGDGIYAYVSYKVNTKVEVGAGKFQQSSVVRRYSDFAWLHDQLAAKNPGLLIPPLPEKAVVGRFSPMFVDNRRRGLELFLIRISQHKQLAKSEDYRLFLFGGQNFQDAKEGKMSQQKKTAARGFFDYFSEISQSVSTTLTGAKEREKSKDDVTCDAISTYADNLETSVSSVHKNISVLTKRTKEMANAWFDFGFACTLLGQYETEQEEPALGSAFAKLGNCADRLSVLLTQNVDNQIVHFQEPFHDFLRIVGAVKEMLKSRQAALARYHAALSHLEAKQAALQKYQQRPGKEDRALHAEAEVSEAQKKVNEESEQLQEVTTRVFAETARFRKEKKHNFKTCLAEFVRTQIEHAKKMQSAWESVLPEIDALPNSE